MNRCHFFYKKWESVFNQSGISAFHFYSLGLHPNETMLLFNQLTPLFNVYARMSKPHLISIIDRLFPLDVHACVYKQQ